MNPSTAPYRHWSREPWPWILMALPASAVVAGMITLWLAIRSNDSLVVDDYYKEGKAINQRIARDARASELGLAASVIERAGQLDVTLDGRLPAPVAALEARFVHVAKSDYDHTQLVLAGPGGHLVGQLPKLVPGRYRLHLAPPGGDWRLVSEVFEAGDSIGRLEIRSGAIARYRIEAKP
ncbi:MAG: FixH family protein [Burkholderiaceae bacterium]